MDRDRIKDDFGQTWKWLAEGWRHVSAKAANALTYFTPAKPDEQSADLRWGLLAADVTEHDDRVVVELEVPGLSREDIDVTVEDRRVVVTGTKHFETSRSEGAMRITERAFGSFQRVLPMPERVTAEGARASYRSGVLTLEVPKAQPPGARKISVVSG